MEKQGRSLRLMCFEDKCFPSYDINVSTFTSMLGQICVLRKYGPWNGVWMGIQNVGIYLTAAI